MMITLSALIFIFQAEDGIRDYKVTGVQTCALPICCVQVGAKAAEVGDHALRGQRLHPAHGLRGVRLVVEDRDLDRHLLAAHGHATGGVDVLDGDLVAGANLRTARAVTPSEWHDGSDLDRLSRGQSWPADERREDSEAQQLPWASGHDALLFDAILMMSPGRRNHPWVGRGRASGRGYSACDRPASTR